MLDIEAGRHKQKMDAESMLRKNGQLVKKERKELCPLFHLIYIASKFNFHLYVLQSSLGS